MNSTCVFLASTPRSYTKTISTPTPTCADKAVGVVGRLGRLAALGELPDHTHDFVVGQCAKDGQVDEDGASHHPTHRRLAVLGNLPDDNDSKRALTESND